jgi:hypothetical protein
MPDLDNDADPQDGAEAFDETNRQDGLLLDSDDEGDEPDIAPDVYDVTSALGDADDEDGPNYELDAADGVESIDGDDLEDDEDEDDSLDGFEEQPEDDDIDDEDAVDVAAALPRSSEPGLSYVADVDPSTTPRDDEVEKYESTRPLSDAQLRTLGYRDAKS